MDNIHILLIGHPKGYYQLIDFLLSKDFWVTRTVKSYLNEEYGSGKYHEIIVDILNNYDEAISRIKEIDKERKIDAVLSVHEFYQYARCKIAKDLGLRTVAPKKILDVTNKFYMKKMFTSEDILTARYLPIDMKCSQNQIVEMVEKSLEYPVIVKSCNGMGSLGVTRANNKKELQRAVILNRQIARTVISSSTTKESQSHLIVEEYIAGKEFTVDGFIINSKWIPMIVCYKYPDMDGPTFQEPMYLFDPLEKTSPLPKDLLDAAQKAVTATEIDNSPFHIEIRRNEKNGQCYIIEMAPRMSGMGSTFYNLMLYSTGISIYEIFVKQNLGQNIKIDNISYQYATLELDAYAKKGGIIKEYKNLNLILEHPNLVFYEKFKNVGDYIQGPGVNPETAIVFYFKCKSSKDLKELADWLWNNFEIIT